MNCFSVAALCAAAAGLGAVAGRLSTVSLIRRLRTQIGTLTRLAHQDRVSGVLNRAGIQDAYTGAQGRDRHLILVDLDAFKSANDRHGHPAGDRILAALGSRLADLASQFDGWAGRLGGDEFALLVPAATQRTAETVAAAATAPLVISDLPTGPLTVSGSAGLAFAPAGYPWTRALTDADIALYQAKRCGVPVSYEHGMTYPRVPWPRRNARDADGQ
ncbi:GGDEF domain-containing protein [Actinoplanes aureus]|uniref:GGDEF domain-containing protein n=1 Tax=Actinoplanes aureus TaxID=2792083 RepID=A0A931CHQ9_9ACTN|nr:GGDEF domain-containing protein [Actinoplanes aureus]MBG0568819.1 GGDEF domain-containing protein [Actinoplanes aureus]